MTAAPPLTGRILCKLWLTEQDLPYEVVIYGLSAKVRPVAGIKLEVRDPDRRLTGAAHGSVLSSGVYNVNINTQRVLTVLVDILILADSVQVADNKLYLLGGGWRYIRARSLPAAHQMGVGVGILVDWEETNERHAMRLELWHEDSHSILMKIEGEFEQGRPPGIPAGSQQRVLMAFNSQVKLERDGPYRISFFIDAQQFAETTFTVVNQSRHVQPGANAAGAPGP